MVRSISKKEYKKKKHAGNFHPEGNRNLLLVSTEDWNSERGKLPNLILAQENLSKTKIEQNHPKNSAIPEAVTGQARDIGVLFSGHSNTFLAKKSTTIR